eukprot:scaffold147689_cov21-Tisochrysis_lutea.AAC.1
MHFTPAGPRNGGRCPSEPSHCLRTAITNTNGCPKKPSHHSRRCTSYLQIQGMEDVVRQSQAYSTTLQTYNTSLQNDLKEEKMKREEASRERDMLQVRVAEEVPGSVACLTSIPGCASLLSMRQGKGNKAKQWNNVKGPLLYKLPHSASSNVHSL